MRSPKYSARLLAACLLLGLFPNPHTFAQQVKTPVTIAVTDRSGAMVPHAQVRLIPAPDPAPALMETNETGKLRLDLLPGRYPLFVTRAGFKTSATRITVNGATAGQTITVSLEVASSGLAVNYPAGQPPLVLSAMPYHDEILLTAAELKVLPHISVTIHNPHANTDETYSGVRVSDLLTKMDAPLNQELRGFALASYVVATGSDGYQAVFSLAEVDPSFHPGEILVADAMNGSPLDAKTGPFRLVVTEDKRPARSVRNLVEIELKSAD